MQSKICPKCRKEKLISNFGKNKSRKDGLQYQCRTCCTKYGRNYLKNNPEKVRKWHRKSELKRDYGISEDEYNSMMKSQNGLCSICGNPETVQINNKVKKLAVDHNHKTGQVRGLLCQKCNVKLAYIEDIEFVCKAREYLSKYEII